MTERKEIKVLIAEHDEDFMSRPVDEIIEDLKEILKEASCEGLQDVICACKVWHGYGGDEIKLEFYGHRMETEKEAQGREAREVALAEDQIAKDMAEYERLKEKLGM